MCTYGSKERVPEHYVKLRTRVLNADPRDLAAESAGKRAGEIFDGNKCRQAREACWEVECRPAASTSHSERGCQSLA